MNEVRVTEEQAKARADAAQRSAADPKTSAWVSASAGTGKTTVLVDRVLRLLLEGVAPQRILCITFTKAAAAEMANRVDRELADWAVQDDTALAKTLTDLAGAPPDAKHLDRARTLFARVLEVPGGLQIYTIHAFCQTVLKRFPIEAGIAPHFTVIDERDGGGALTDARRAAIESARENPGGELAQALATVASFAGEQSFAALLDALLAQPERLRHALADGHAVFTQRLQAALGVGPDETEAGVVAAACAPDKARDGRLRLAAEAMLAAGGTKDAGAFLGAYTSQGILPQDPFVTLDRDGVGELVRIASDRGRAARSNLKLGICGEHGGDPASIAFCEEVGLDYVSCSPFRVPVARLEAGRAAVDQGVDPGSASS